MALLCRILLPLLLTVVLEGALMLLITRSWRCVLYSVLCNGLTNPAINLAMCYASALGAKGYYIVLSVLELAAVLIEAACYRAMCGWQLRRALVVSLALNAFSFCVGCIIL